VGFLRTVWDMATGADFHFDTTEGKRPPLVKPINRYMDALFTARTTISPSATSPPT